MAISRFHSPQARTIPEDGETLDTYDFVTSLIVTPGQKEKPGVVKSEWRSPIPTFTKLHWIGGEMVPRPRTYLSTSASEIDADAAFRDAFDSAVDESVEREDLDRK